MADVPAISTLDTKIISDTDTPFSAVDNAYLRHPIAKDYSTKGCCIRTSTLELVDRCIDEVRTLKVAVIGGLAGITAGILLPAKVPVIDLTIVEKNHDLVSSSPRKSGHR